MRDYISTRDEPPSTLAPLQGVPSPVQAQSPSSQPDKYAMMNEEIKFLQRENADLKSALHGKTFKSIQSSTELKKTLAQLYNASGVVEQSLRNKITELTAERDSSRQSCSIAETALKDLKQELMTRNLQIQSHDDEHTNYHTLMTNMEEDNKSLLKQIVKLKSIHVGELKQIRDQLRWCRAEYNHFEARSNFTIHTLRQDFEFARRMMFQSNNNTQRIKNALTKCSKDFWKTKEKLNSALDREPRLREELEIVTEQSDKARSNHIVSVQTLQDLNNSTTGAINNEAKTGENMVIPINTIIKNTSSNNHEVPLSTHSSCTPEAENLNRAITNHNVDELERGDGRRLQEECLLGLNDWKLVNFCDMTGNNMQTKLPAVPIPQFKLEQAEIKKIDPRDKADELEM